MFESIWGTNYSRALGFGISSFLSDNVQYKKQIEIHARHTGTLHYQFILRVYYHLRSHSTVCVDRINYAADAILVQGMATPSIRIHSLW